MKITHCKLKKKVQKKLLRFFVLEVTARSAADILGIHPNSAVLFYRKIRMVISHRLTLAADEVFDGSVELDESYFGGRRKGRRGRGAAGKVVVFGILKRNGRVYTVVVDNAKSESLLPVIKKKIMPDSIVYTDSLSSYDKLDVSGFIVKSLIKSNKDKEPKQQGIHISQPPLFPQPLDPCPRLLYRVEIRAIGRKPQHRMPLSL